MKKIKLHDNLFSVSIVIVSLPALIFILPINFITSSIGILLGVYLMKLGDIKDIYRKTISKVLIFSVISYFIGLLFITLIQYIYPLELLDTVSEVVIVRSWIGLVASIIVGISIYFFNRFITFQKIEMKSKNFLAFFLAIVSSPFIFLVPSGLINDVVSEYEDLLKYENTLIGDASGVVNLIDNLDSGNYRETVSLKTTEKPYELIIEYTDETIFNDYKIMEKDSAILLRLITNLDIITFNQNDKTHSFTIDYFNEIYNSDIKEMPFEKIMERYNGEYLSSDDYVYLGNVYGTYDIMDESDWCSDELEVIHEDDDNYYLISCSQVDYIFAVDRDNNKYTIKEVLNDGLILPKDILKTNIKLHVEEKQ